MALLSACLGLSYEEVLGEVGADGLLRFQTKNWRQRVKNEDYAMFVLLTATDSRLGCALCREFDPTYTAVAAAYWESLQEAPLDADADEKSKIVFAIADFAEVRELFQVYDIRKVPKMYYYAPGRGPQVLEPNDEYQFLVDDSRENFHRWVLDLVRGMDPRRLQGGERTSSASIVAIAVAIAFVAVFAYWKRTLVVSVLQSKALWEWTTLGLIVLFVSGHMYNQIRKTPNTREDPNGRTIFIQPGQQVQLGAETKLVFVLYSVMVTAVVMLLKCRRRRWLVLGSGLALALAYSMLVNAFGIKSVNYPFKLFKR